jgi:hypothetical protein
VHPCRYGNGIAPSTRFPPAFCKPRFGGIGGNTQAVKRSSEEIVLVKGIRSLKTLHSVRLNSPHLASQPRQHLIFWSFQKNFAFLSRKTLFRLVIQINNLL